MRTMASVCLAFLDGKLSSIPFSQILLLLAIRKVDCRLNTHGQAPATIIQHLGTKTNEDLSRIVPDISKARIVSLSDSI